MQLDIERYRPYLDQFDMGEDQKIELVQIVSHIMQSFVDRAFCESPAQALLGANAFSSGGSESLALDSTPIQTIFNDAADGAAEKESRHDR